MQISARESTTFFQHCGVASFQRPLWKPESAHRVEVFASESIPGSLALGLNVRETGVEDAGAGKPEVSVDLS